MISGGVHLRLLRMYVTGKVRGGCGNLCCLENDQTISIDRC